MNRLCGFLKYLETREPYDPDEHWIQYIGNMRKIKRDMPELEGLSEFMIQELYRDYSHFAYRADWMHVSKATILDFRMWLSLKPRETDQFTDFGEPIWYHYCNGS